MNIGKTNVRTVPLSTDVDDALELLVDKGGYEPEALTTLPSWLERGDDIIVFELADLGVILTGNFPLYWAMPWERDEPTPRQAPDTHQCGLGWRYLPALRVSVDA